MDERLGLSTMQANMMKHSGAEEAGRSTLDRYTVLFIVRAGADVRSTSPEYVYRVHNHQSQPHSIQSSDRFKFNTMM